MDDLIERLRQLAADCNSSAAPLRRALIEAADALEAARVDADAVRRVLAVVEEFEGCTAAGYRYMAANIRGAIDTAREARNG